MKPRSTAYCFNRRFQTGILAANVVVCLCSTSSATTWVGDVNDDWNNNLNWSGDAGTGGSNAIINISTSTPPFPVVSSSPASAPSDIFVGNGGLSGRLDHPSGTLSTGVAGRMWVGVGNVASNGTYNLANTSTTGGSYTGFGTGSGSLAVASTSNGQLYVGGDDAGADKGTGVININTSGSLSTRAALFVGAQGGTGTFNLDAGTVTIGSVANASNSNVNIGITGGSGAFRMSGGTFNCYSGFRLGQLGNSAGTLLMSGGTINKGNTGNFVVGNGDATTTVGVSGAATQTGGTINVTAGELWVGNGTLSSGTYTMQGGSLSVNSWFAVGRSGGTGNFTMTGGTITKTGTSANHFIVGASGPGVMNISGGLVDVQQGLTWVGEQSTATTATLTISGTAEYRSSVISVGPGSSNAILNLDGGVVRTSRIIGRSADDMVSTQIGTGTVHFNGSQIIATGITGVLDFIDQSIDSAVIDSGNLKVDSNGFNVNASGNLTGTGGLVKSGAGKLTLKGFNSYAGTNQVNGGELILSSSGTGGGAITVADGASLGISAIFSVFDQLPSSSATFGTTSAGTTLNIDRGDLNGSNPTLSILDVTGPLALNGNVTVNVSGTEFQASMLPLITYSSKSGSGNFVMGTLPNGVIATLVDDPNYYGPGSGLVYLNVTSVSLPKWDGTDSTAKFNKSADLVEMSPTITVTDASGITVGQAVSGPSIAGSSFVQSISGNDITLDKPVIASSSGEEVVFTTLPGSNDGIWNTTTANWVDMATGNDTTFANLNPVSFDDSATGPTVVTLNSTVSPVAVEFNNSKLAYSLSGTGKITGSTPLTKGGTADVAINNANENTGVITITGGSISIPQITNGGVPGPIGAAGAAPSNLVLAGGSLNYTGPSATVDRGFTVSGTSSGVAVASGTELTLSGSVVASGNNSLQKKGAGTLTFTGGSQSFGSGGFQSEVLAGTLKLAGSSSRVTSVAGELWVGSSPLAPANLVVENGNLTVASWIAVGRGNGNAGHLSTLTSNGAAIQCVGFSTGYIGSQSTNDSDQDVILNNSSFTNAGPTLLAESQNSSTTLTLSGTSSFTSTAANNNGRILMGFAAGGVCNVTVSDSSTLSNAGGWFSVGNSSSATAALNIEDNATVSTVGDFNVGDTGTSQGTVNLSGTATFNSAGAMYIGKNNGTNGTFVMSGGTVNANSWVSVGRFSGGTGTLTIQGGVFNQAGAGFVMLVGEEGSGTLNMEGGSLNLNGGALVISKVNGANLGTGIVNLDGGTITTNQIREDGGGASSGTFVFNGGLLKVGSNPNTTSFMGGLDQAIVNPGGAFINTNGQIAKIGQVLSNGGGGLTKSGSGTLLLNAANTYTGTTLVSAGALGGSGSVAGSLVVSSSASITPGDDTVGTFAVGGSADISGTYVCQVSGATSDALNITGTLTISPGSILDVATVLAPSASPLIIASYGSLGGTFATVLNLPAGYSIDYNYLGQNKIALVQAAASAYDAWASGYGLNPLTDGAPSVDKDGDGQSNAMEFALGGNPTSGSNNARIHVLAADTSADTDSAQELVLTIAVRTSTPTFAGSPSPTASLDGFVCTVQGSLDLSGFNAAVVPVDPITLNLPAAPAGYEYRSFSLVGSNGTPSKGFLRVKVNY